MLSAVAALVLAPSLADRVLVIENTQSPASIEIVEEYAKRRGVKAILKVACQNSAESTSKETMSYADFREQVEKPLRAVLKAKPQIDFIVLTKGVPIRLTGAPDTGMVGTQPSLDSFIAALDYPETRGAIKISISDSGFNGKAWANRFWNPTKRFSHKEFGGYLVSRLDGYTVQEAKGLVAWAMQAEREKPEGRFLLDACPAFGFGDPAKQPLSAIRAGEVDPKVVNEMAFNEFNSDMERAAQDLAKAGFNPLLDKTDLFVGSKGGLLGYCSWGSNDAKYVADNYHSLRFAPGGLAETAVSTSARTFLPTTGGQSLIADLIRQRVTGVKGYCDEPLLQAVASPTILFGRYTRGWTLAESFYAASRFVGWEDIVIGDPICAPYAARIAHGGLPAP
ncbi:MAG: TIGR03790 family protein [Armatimonadetes bacterium]|nr:TIGR03790 family protein [Armatimonadota bacterium]